MEHPSDFHGVQNHVRDGEATAESSLELLKFKVKNSDSLSSGRIQTLSNGVTAPGAGLLFSKVTSLRPEYLTGSNEGKLINHHTEVVNCKRLLTAHESI